MRTTFITEARGDLIFATEAESGFYAIYTKPSGEPQLILKSRAATNDHGLLAAAWHAANTKARELGWIV